MNFLYLFFIIIGVLGIVFLSFNQDNIELAIRASNTCYIAILGLCFTFLAEIVTDHIKRRK